jgi:hypothetical protein
MSTLKADTIVASDGTSPVTLTKQITAKSFEIHDDDSTTLIESFNMSSITDGAAGICSPVFTNNMATSDYFTAASTGEETTSFGIVSSVRYNSAATTSTYTYVVNNSSNVVVDRNNTMSANIGDLA